MKRLLHRLILLMCVSCTLQTLKAQNADTTEGHIRHFLANHYQKYPQEKVFIHTGKNWYAGGQTIWFKAYATAYGKPSELSGILYVQLVDSAGNVVIKNKLQLKKGLAHGNIDIPDSVRSGWYQLTAFTAWMLNFGEDGFYHQKLYVQNLARVTSNISKESTNSKYHITFFPEGGDPVEGSLCNIAFKVIDANGMPVKAEGEVLDNDKKTIAKIVTVHDGMGLFSIEGYAGKKNMAVVRFPDHSVQTMELPAFKKEGLVLQVNALPPDAIELKIMFAGDIKRYSNVLLAAYQVNGIFDTYPIQLKNGI
ncbi:MAG TPA: hypothetical protein VHW43_00290, partial [Puia sp.]|nr:hypothetical protein [Puia sp.]